MPLTIIRDNIVNARADAIVNTANPLPLIGSGTDTAVYEAAGEEELLAARKAIGVIAEGDAAVTPAFGLDAKIIIHTVSPVWDEAEKETKTELLASCYRKSMELALEHGCERIAFPLLASGSNGFPKDIALNTALNTIQSFLLSHDMDVLLVVFDRSSFELSSRVFHDVREYIQEHQVIEAEDAEYAPKLHISGRRRRRPDLFQLQMPLPLAKEEAAGQNYAMGLVLPKLPMQEDTFQKKLFTLIDESGESDPAVYKRANIDRKLFAKIRKDENYKPSRKTAIALALALKLSLKEAEDLLERAGYALSMSTIFDLIIRYCFEHGVYDIIEVNSILFEFDQEML